MKHSSVAVMSLLFFLFANGSRAQTVEVGPDGVSIPRATPQYCSSVEPIRPNLKLVQATTVQGRITDQSTAPLRDSPIALRRYISENKQITVKKVSTGSDGQFVLGEVKPGEYRLLLSPHRGFKQAEKLECASKNCTLNVMLILNPTDQPAAACPIR